MRPGDAVQRGPAGCDSLWHVNLGQPPGLGHADDRAVVSRMPRERDEVTGRRIRGGPRPVVLQSIVGRAVPDDRSSRVALALRCRRPLKC